MIKAAASGATMPPIQTVAANDEKRGLLARVLGRP
jgi:hypothetical protein